MTEPSELDAANREALRYRRANAHTLEVLEKVAAMIDGIETPAFVVYVSDHGENLLADHNGMHFHFSARTTKRAAYVPSFVFWNAAFSRAQHPLERLGPMLNSATLAHADIYKIWMNFASLPAELVPTKQPTILGKARLTDPVAAIPCGSLAP